MKTEYSDEFIDSDWPKFTANVGKRLIVGKKEYGDQSHRLSNDRLLIEIQQELEDVAGWAAIMWAKLDKLKCSSAPTVDSARS